MRQVLGNSFALRVRNLFSTRSAKKRRSHRSFKTHSRRMRLESLEERTLLAATGLFERQEGGGVSTFIEWATANARGGEVDGIAQISNYDPLTDVTATSRRSNGTTATGSATMYTQGRISVDVDETTRTPLQIANSFYEVASEGEPTPDWAFGAVGFINLTSSNYIFNADNSNDEHEFHGYLALAGGMEQLILGDGLIGQDAFLLVRIGSSAFGTYEFSASRYNSPNWSWYFDDPNSQGIDASGFGPLPAPFTFTESISDGDDLYCEVRIDMYAFSENLPDYHDEWWAENFSSTAAATYGYVTLEGGNTLPGDFNFDDDVDGNDFDLWQQENPQADANLDGVVDDADLLIWAQNTDELVVTSESDGIDGNYTWGNLTLREAIALAADNVNRPGHDSIFFAPHVDEIVLSGSPLSFGTANPFTIRGLGADRLTINGNQSVSYLFWTYYAPNFEVTIRDVELRGATSYAMNVSMGPTLKLDGVEVAGNGQGINYAYGSTLTISNSTIAENNGTAVGVAYATANLYNTTISGNQTSGPTTAGLTVVWGAANLTNVTITNNRSDKNKTTGTSTGIGGVYAGSAATLTLHNTIVVGNFAGAVSNSIAADIGRASSGSYVGTFHSSSSHNLIGSAPSGAFPTGNENQIGVTAASVGLLALAANKGKTRTHALAQGSIAIDAGDNAKAAALGLLLDQRGYPRLFDGDFDDIETIDIGAYERAWDDF